MKNSNIDSVKLLLQSRPSWNLDLLNNAVLQAAGVGHPGIVDLLLRCYPFQFLKTPTPSLQWKLFSEALNEASEQGHLAIVKALVVRGAAPDAQALNTAVRSNRTDVFRFLIHLLRCKFLPQAPKVIPSITPDAVAHCDSDLLSWLWKGPTGPYYPTLLARLHKACHSGNLAAVEWLLEGADCLSHKAFLEALVGASAAGHIKIVMFFLQMGVEVNTVDAWKAAARGGHTDILELLLSTHSTVLSPGDLGAALVASVECGHMGTTLQLLCAGAPIDDALAIAQDPVIQQLVKTFCQRI